MEQQSWSLSELALEAGRLGLPTLWHMCPESTQLQCSKLFNHIRFAVGTSVSKKPARSKYFLKALQVIKQIKRLFLKDHLLRFNKPLSYGSCNCLHICCHVGTSASVKNQDKAQGGRIWLEEDPRFCGIGHASKPHVTRRTAISKSAFLC